MCLYFSEYKRFHESEICDLRNSYKLEGELVQTVLKRIWLNPVLLFIYFITGYAGFMKFEGKNEHQIWFENMAKIESKIKFKVKRKLNKKLHQAINF